MQRDDHEHREGVGYRTAHGGVSDPSLETLYRAIVQVVSVAANVREDLWETIYGRFRTPLHRRVVIGLWRRDVLFGGPDQLVAGREAARTAASDDRLVDALVRTLADGVWPENLAVFLTREFKLTQSDVKALIRLHDLHFSLFRRVFGLGAHGLLGFVLAASALLASQVPEAVFTKVGWDYAAYRVVLLLALVIGLLIVAGVWTATHVLLSRAARDQQLVSVVLTYIDALWEQGDPTDSAMRARRYTQFPF